jgi:hypothetical protein
MKPKTGIESGTSPTGKVGPSGARIMTGEHLTRIREDIQRRFAVIHETPTTAEPRIEAACVTNNPAAEVYSEKHEVIFAAKADALAKSAAVSCRIYSPRRRGSYYVGSLDAPRSTAEELYKAALESK